MAIKIIQNSQKICQKKEKFGGSFISDCKAYCKAIVFRTMCEEYRKLKISEYNRIQNSIVQNIEYLYDNLFLTNLLSHFNEGEKKSSLKNQY